MGCSMDNDHDPTYHRSPAVPPSFISRTPGSGKQIGRDLHLSKGDKNFRSGLEEHTSLSTLRFIRVEPPWRRSSKVLIIICSLCLKTMGAQPSSHQSHIAEHVFTIITVSDLRGHKFTSADG